MVKKQKEVSDKKDSSQSKNGIASLFESNDENKDSEFYKILKELIDSENNLDLKTEINKPFQFTALKTFSEFVNSLGFTISANMLEEFIKTSFKYLVSKKRKGRKEIVDALKQSSLMLQPPNPQDNLSGVKY